MHDLHLQIELLLEANQRNHDLGLHFDAVLQHGCRRLKNGPRLHLGNLGKLDPQPAAAEAEHRIELVQLIDPLHDLIDGRLELLSDFLLTLGVIVLRQELMQRWIEEANARRQAVQRPENAFKIFLLVGQ